MGIAVSLLVLSLVILVHEWGHYIVMRRNGVRVLEFSLFLGPALFQRKMRSGTVFSLRLLPLGGYVNFATTGEGAIGDASRWARFKIYMAGMFVNSIAAFLTLLVLFYATGSAPDMLVDLCRWAPAPLRPLVCAFLGSFGIWFATPFLFAWLVVSKGMGFMDGAAGPIGIVAMGNTLVHQAATPTAFVVSVALYFAMINGAVAGFNLLPLPPLDGGQAFALLIEKLTGKKMGRVETAYRLVSMVIFFALALLIVGGDLLKYVIR